MVDNPLLRLHDQDLLLPHRQSRMTWSWTLSSSEPLWPHSNSKRSFCAATLRTAGPLRELPCFAWPHGTPPAAPLSHPCKTKQLKLGKVSFIKCSLLQFLCIYTVSWNCTVSSDVHGVSHCLAREDSGHSENIVLAKQISIVFIGIAQLKKRYNPSSRCATARYRSIPQMTLLSCQQSVAFCSNRPVPKIRCRSGDSLCLLQQCSLGCVFSSYEERLKFQIRASTVALCEVRRRPPCSSGSAFVPLNLTYPQHCLGKQRSLSTRLNCLVKQPVKSWQMILTKMWRKGTLSSTVLVSHKAHKLRHSSRTRSSSKCAHLLVQRGAGRTADLQRHAGPG